MERIEWFTRAKSDLIDIYNYISKDSIYYAIKTVNEIIKRTEILYNFPYMGKKIQEIPNSKYRVIIYKSYKIIYEVDSQVIYIIRIWHSARKISNIFLK